MSWKGLYFLNFRTNYEGLGGGGEPKAGANLDGIPLSQRKCRHKRKWMISEVQLKQSVAQTQNCIEDM